jgi:hypothetical protein
MKKKNIPIRILVYQIYSERGKRIKIVNFKIDRDLKFMEKLRNRFIFHYFKKGMKVFVYFKYEELTLENK